MSNASILIIMIGCVIFGIGIIELYDYFLDEPVTFSEVIEPDVEKKSFSYIEVPMQDGDRGIITTNSSYYAYEVSHKKSDSSMIVEQLGWNLYLIAGNDDIYNIKIINTGTYKLEINGQIKIDRSPTLHTGILIIIGGTMMLCFAILYDKPKLPKQESVKQEPKK